MSDEEEEEEEEESSTSKPLFPVEAPRKESRIRIEKSQSEIGDPNGKKSDGRGSGRASTLESEKKSIQLRITR